MKKATIIIALLICVTTAACSEKPDLKNSAPKATTLDAKEKVELKRFQEKLEELEKKPRKSIPNTF